MRRPGWGRWAEWYRKPLQRQAGAAIAAVGALSLGLVVVLNAAGYAAGWGLTGCTASMPATG